MSSQLMVDIETMATTPNAAILSIGACTFDIARQDRITHEFNIGVSLTSNEKEGRYFSAGTMEWWLKQSKAAQEGLFEGEITNLRQALVRFRMWADSVAPKITHVWANDPDFDCVILQDAFRQINEMWPFQYYMNRSVRTIGELAYPDPDERKRIMTSFRAEGTHHKAVDDAIAQAKFVQHCYAALRPEVRHLA